MLNDAYFQAFCDQFLLAHREREREKHFQFYSVHLTFYFVDFMNKKFQMRHIWKRNAPTANAHRQHCVLHVVFPLQITN